MIHSQMPLPPVDMPLPELPYQIVTLVSFAVLAVFAVLLALESRRRRSPLPLLFLVGGGLGVILEPFLDVMVCVWYPLGATPLIRAFDVSVPFWLGAAWAIYFGAQSYYIYRAVENGMEPRRLYMLIPLFWVTNIIIEIPALQFGLYTYYGDQAFQVFGFPVWMGLENALGPVCIAMQALLLKPYLQGPRLWLLPLLVPASALGCAAVVGFPMWWALNSGAGLSATIVATFVVAIVAFTLVSLYVSLLQKRAGLTAGTAPGTLSAA